MQRPWSTAAWRPTIYRTNPAQSPPIPPQAAAHHIQRVQELTASHSGHVYDPSAWCARASHLLALGYPELAASDAYKAILLCDYPNGIMPESKRKPSPADGPPSAADNSTVEPLGRGHHVDRKSAYCTLIQALYDCHCHPDALDICKEAEQRFPEDPFFRMKVAELSSVAERKVQHVATGGGSPVMQHDRLYDGAVLTILYPWMEPRHLQRSPILIDYANQEFQKNFNTCRLSHSSIAGPPVPTHTGHVPQVLGVFSTREIDPGECILVDRTATGASSSAVGCTNCFRRITETRVEAVCCATVFCGQDCYQLSISTYHQAICGKDFTWLQDTVHGIWENAAAMRPLLMFRYLAACVQAGAALHPLDHPLIARLQPQMSGRHLDVFTLNESLIRPIQVLQQLGIDVFENLDFDTWVLHTIWTRLANNKQGFPRRADNGGGWIDSLSPLMPFFNHSCEPNVECWHDDTTTVRFFARRHIQEGEELFDSYANVDGLALETRQQILWPWFEGPCLCSRCSRESISRHGVSQQYVTAKAEP